MKKNRVLIIVFKGIGDVVLTTPLIKAIKKNRPESEILFLTRKFAAKVLENNPDVSQVIIREEKPLMKILKAGPDSAIDFMLSSSSGSFSLFSGARKRIAFFRPWGRIFYNCMVKSDYSGYTVRRRLELLKPLGINPEDIEDLRPEVYPSDKNFKKIERWSHETNLDFSKQKIATFDITSPRAYRMLSPEKFSAMAKWLYENKGLKPVFLAGPGEETYVETAVKELCRVPFLTAFGFDLLDLAALLSHASLHVGTSSSPMHIAVSRKVSTFTVYSPQTDPKSWSPPAPEHGWIQSGLAELTEKKLLDELSSFSGKINL